MYSYPCPQKTGRQLLVPPTPQTTQQSINGQQQMLTRILYCWTLFEQTGEISSRLKLSLRANTIFLLLLQTEDIIDPCFALQYITTSSYKNKSPTAVLLLADSTYLFTCALSRTFLRQKGKIKRNNRIVSLYITFFSSWFNFNFEGLSPFLIGLFWSIQSEFYKGSVFNRKSLTLTIKLKTNY